MAEPERDYTKQKKKKSKKWSEKEEAISDAQFHPGFGQDPRQRKGKKTTPASSKNIEMKNYASCDKLNN